MVDRAFVGGDYYLRKRCATVIIHKLFRRSTLYGIWDLPEAIEGVPFVQFVRRVEPLSLSAIEDILHGTIWSLICPLLTTDDVVRCRTMGRRRNVDCRYGELGHMFFEFLENDPFVRHWCYDEEGNRV